MGDAEMTATGPPVEALLPERSSLPALREAATGCRACELWRLGTQTVFGEGAANAEVVLVGEQPGDREDVEGHPFVGPAGAELDHALREAGLEREAIYVTNVVKHFRWTQRGKRRLHQKPDAAHVAACLPWLRAELETVRPRLLVCLGATAAQAVLGPQVRVLRDRGQFYPSPLDVTTMPTVHPSSILRAPDAGARERAHRDFVADLATAADWLRR
ncbi:MAG TPA: UdgX family uracil-DNA binding protein [Candidatus Dormibacteraeota bacterium]|nr:UdgX family uracil-DNA binding protein [Candidatus Dormibacteraeota bacterium]